MRRFTLAPFPLLALVLGAGYYFGDPARTAVPSFKAAKEFGAVLAAPLPITPMQVWGVVFLIGAAVLTVALIVDDPRLLHAALLIGGGIYAWWAVVLFVAALDGASANAWATYAFIAITHYVAAGSIEVPQ